MATDATKSITGASGSNAANALGSFVSSTKNEQISKDQFLQLLVTQLKNQDPLDPMKSEEFAVNLAQFSQLEQLVSINGKIGNQGASGNLSSMAGYLGQQVTLNSKTLGVDGSDGGFVKVNLPENATAVHVDLMDASGAVRESLHYGAATAGKHLLPIQTQSVTTGQFSFRVRAEKAGGQLADIPGQPSGIVSGFIPGDSPKLIVNGQEVNAADVVEVEVPPKAA